MSGHGSVWVVTPLDVGTVGDTALWRINSVTGEIEAVIEFDGAGLDDIAVERIILDPYVPALPAAPVRCVCDVLPTHLRRRR